MRQAGHTGLAIEHYVWDRLGIQSLERHCRQWHAHLSMRLDDMAEEANTTVQILRLSELVVVTACGGHDAQNAFRWSMGDAAKNKVLLRDTYVGIESLRNSLDLITALDGAWVAVRLSYKEYMEGPS